MKIAPDQAYKLVETDGHISIIPRDMNIADTSTQPLIIADKEKLCDYLLVYLTLREQGKSLKHAHNGAMEYVGITVVKH